MDFSVLPSLYIKEKQEFLEKSFQSIWDDQTLKPNKIIIIKDGVLTKELDDTINDFSKGKPVKVITLKKNIGLGLALQEGMKNCSYEYVARMDSDDIAYPDRFKKQISFLIENPHIDVLGFYISEFIGIDEPLVKYYIIQNKFSVSKKISINFKSSLNIYKLFKTRKNKFFFALNTIIIYNIKVLIHRLRFI